MSTPEIQIGIEKSQTNLKLESINFFAGGN